MADVEWIKITTDMFDNRKIKYLRTLPEGNNIVLVWVMLLTMAGRCNSGGMIFLTENIPYTTKILADELGFDENIVKVAIAAQIKRPARSRSYLYYYIIYYGSDNGDGDRSKKKMKINRLGVGATALI